MRGREHSFRRQAQPCHSGRTPWRNRLAGVALLLAAIGCGLTATGAVLGGETHFLGNCGAGCADGLSCLAGICTRPCTDAATDCAGLGASVSCRQEPAAEPFCDLPCSTDASCAAAGGPGLGCEDGFCRAAVVTAELPALPAAPVDRSDPWWCLGLTPEPLPFADGSLVALVAPMIDYTSFQPLAGRGLQATLCATGDFSCEAPLGSPLPVVADLLGELVLPPAAGAVTLAQGFDGHIRFDVLAVEGTPEAERYLPVDYYPGGSATAGISSGPPILMIQSGTWDTILQRSFPGVDPDAARASGTVMATVSDCNANSVAGARVELSRGAGPLEVLAGFQLPTSRIPLEQPAEQLRSAPGGFGYLGVPPGAVQLRAFRPEDDQLIGQLELGVVSGQLTTGMVRPAYFLGIGIPDGGNLGSTEGAQ